MRILKTVRDNPWLFSILVTAFIVRFAGIFHDLPLTYYSDEEHFISRAMSLGSGDLNPHWFHKPGLFMYLLFFEYGLYFVLGKILGVFASVEDFAVSFFQSKGAFLLLGRLTVALFGVATVYVSYLAGKEFFNKRTGLLAALFLSLSMGHIMSSQVVKADVPSTFFAMLSFYFACRIYASGRLRDYILAGIFAGLGMATKYYPVALIPTILLAHVVYLKKNNLPVVSNLINKSSIAIPVAALIAFFAASPYNFLDPLGFHLTFVHPIAGLVDAGGKSTEVFMHNIGLEVPRFVFLKSIGKYIAVLTSPEGMGAIGIAAILGLILLLVRISPKHIIILSFPLLFILIANKMNPFYSEPRHMNVVFPFMAIFAAYFVNYLHELIDRKTKAVLMTVILTTVIVALPVYSIVRHDYTINLQDTRTLAKEWVESSIPAGTKILIDEDSVFISPNKEYYEEMHIRAGNVEKSQFTVHADTFYKYSLKALPEITYDLTPIRFAWWQKKEEQSGVNFATSERDKDMGNPLKPVGVMEYEYYVENGYEYIIVCNENYEKFVSKDSSRARDFPSFQSFYTTLFAKGELVRKFQAEPGKSRGPIVKIYRVR